MPKQNHPETRFAYPLTAIVGQEEMKLALVLNAIDPLIGGVLIMGHRGTGKSTIVRALAGLLPEISVVAGCVYRCNPVDDSSWCTDCQQKVQSGAKLKSEKSAVSIVELPLGGTEDRVCGTIDIEQALRNGVKRFQPGLLARANRGFLYIDEVNLLEDHLVDLLLDVAASGVNKVERENVSVEHPTRFVLIGSGNPEEGELRPQLVDRFGLSVEVKTEDDLDRRVEIVERRTEFDANPEGFTEKYSGEQAELQKLISRARKNRSKVKISRELLKQIAQLCSTLKVDGHRGELTITRASRAAAALEGRKQVSEEDVRKVAAMSLRHRLRRDVLEETPDEEKIERTMEKVFESGSPQSGAAKGEPSEGRAQRNKKSGDHNGSGSNGGVDSRTKSPVPSVENKVSQFKLEAQREENRRKSASGSHQTRGSSGKRVEDNQRGRYSRATAIRTSARPRMALDATLRAMLDSGFRVSTTPHNQPPQPFPVDTLRFKVFKKKQGRLFIFAIDLSGSMALNRIAQAKGLMLELLRRSYIRRDHVAIVGFRGTTAKILLPPSRSILRARRVLDSVSVGGGTPLPAGVACCLHVAQQTKDGEKVMLLFTDGHANVALQSNGNVERATRQRLIDKELLHLGTSLKNARITSVVISTQQRFKGNDDAKRIADIMGARFENVASGVS